MKRSHLAVAVTAAVLLAASGADAKTLSTVSYPYDQVFPGAVRFLRIDERMTIVEKDRDAGYIVFELVDDGKTYQGSFEVARVRDDDGRDASRLVVRIQDRPAYMEQGLIDRFGVKLREELGDPPDPPPPPKKNKKKQQNPKHEDSVAKGDD
jgi:hypothetical protein